MHKAELTIASNIFLSSMHYTVFYNLLKLTDTVVIEISLNCLIMEMHY